MTDEEEIEQIQELIRVSKDNGLKDLNEMLQHLLNS